jgi:hypothetical protein
VRERQQEDADDLEKFKQAMIAANPEYASQIVEDFDAAERGEYADPVDDDEELQRLDGNSLEAALEQLRTLGIGLSD